MHTALSAGVPSAAAASWGSLGDRVRRAEESAWVGREPELNALLDLLADAHRLPHAVCLTGPPGIGKTALLRELAQRVERADAGHAILVDCHEFDGSVEGLVSLVRRSAPGWPECAAVAPTLLGIDSYELLSMSDRRRLREQFLEQLTGRVLVVIADRQAPRDLLTQRVGWRDHQETLALSPLEDGEARRLLALRGVIDDTIVTEILSLAGGQPLVLATAASIALHGGERPLPSWLIAGSVIRTLHRRLRREASHPILPELLEASSLLPVVNHDLLSAMLGADLPDLEGVFSGLSIVEMVPDGYSVDQPWRRLLGSDLLRRRPRRHAELVARARAHLAGGGDGPSAPLTAVDPPLRVVGGREDPPLTADRAARERVKLALEALHDPDALARRWPVPDPWVDTGGDAGRRLQHRLREIIGALAGSRSPRVAQAGRVLHLYYVAQAGSLEMAAERLCVSRATLFRRLSLGLTLVYERLVDGGDHGSACA